MPGIAAACCVGGGFGPHSPDLRCPAPRGWQGRKGSPAIPVRGKHLDAFSATDRAFIAFNRLTTPVFTFHALQYLWSSPHVLRAAADATPVSTAAALVALFVAYDSTYCLFHRGLHHRSVYRHVHKHHHRQASRAATSTPPLPAHPAPRRGAGAHASKHRWLVRQPVITPVLSWLWTQWLVVPARMMGPCTVNYLTMGSQ